jgi:vancomycin resistance protein YoaR
MTDTPMTAAHEAALAPLDMPLEMRRPRARVRFFVAFLISMLAALGLGASALYAFDRVYTGRILPGVTVGGIDVAGMTPDEATAVLGQAFASFGEGRAVLTSSKREMTIDYADIDRRPDLDGMVAEAMAVGRSGSTVERIVLDARTAIRGVDIQPKVLFDDAALARYVRQWAAHLIVDAQDAAVTSTKDGFVVVEGVDGQAADLQQPTAQLTAALARVDAPNEVRAALEPGPVEPEVTTAEATEAQAAADRIAIDVAIVEGKESWTIPAATVRTWLTFEAKAGAYQPVVQPAAVDAALEGIAKKVAQSPQNASFTVSGGAITGVTTARSGRALDVAQTSARVSDLLATRAANGANAPVAPALTITAPALTTEEAKAAAPKMKKISTWTTYFPISERNHFGANIWIPAIDIDGYVVGPGEKFDFWNAVGPITRARGYGDGGAIINGKTEPQGALAGGICSCSTTLFNAALRGGFKMGARRNHYYFIDRYPAGLDATVFKSGSGSVQTMSWTNDTDYPVLIRGYKIKNGSKGYVRFDLYSVPSGRKVVIGNPTIKNIRRATDTVQYTSSLAPGARKRIEYPVDGKDIWRTVTVYQGGKILHQTTYYSHYSRITGVTLVGKGG